MFSMTFSVRWSVCCFNYDNDVKIYFCFQMKRKKQLLNATLVPSSRISLAQIKTADN